MGKSNHMQPEQAGLKQGLLQRRRASRWVDNSKSSMRERKTGEAEVEKKFEFWRSMTELEIGGAIRSFIWIIFSLAVCPTAHPIIGGIKWVNDTPDLPPGVGAVPTSLVS